MNPPKCMELPIPKLTEPTSTRFGPTSTRFSPTSTPFQPPSGPHASQPASIYFRALATCINPPTPLFEPQPRMSTHPHPLSSPAMRVNSLALPCVWTHQYRISSPSHSSRHTSQVFRATSIHHHPLSCPQCPPVPNSSHQHP